MTAQEYLVRAYHCQLLIQTKCEQLEMLKGLLTNLSVPTDREQVSCTKDVHSMDEMIARIADLEEEIRADRNTFARYEYENITLINQLASYKDRKIILLRYARYLDWSAVAAELNLSVRRGHTIHKQALDRMTEILRREHLIDTVEDRNERRTYVYFERGIK